MEAARLFAITQIVAVAIPLLLLRFLSTTETVYYAAPLLWALASVLVWLQVRAPIPHDDEQRKNEGWILTRWTGQEAKTRVKVGLALAVGNILSTLLIASSMLLFPTAQTTETFNFDYFPYAPSTFTFKLPFTEIRLVYAGCLMLLAALSGLAVWNLRREIQVTETKWAKPKHHDAIHFAKHGLVFIGHEFERMIESTAISHKDRERSRADDEVAGRAVERLVGRNGPFCIDLIHSDSSHVYAFGSTGKGKTEFGRTLIVRLWNATRIPSLVLDWKGDYSQLVKKMGGVVWSVPESFTINPLKLGGLSPIVRSEAGAELLIDAVQLSALQAGEVVQVIMEAYMEKGIIEGDKSTWSKTPPTIMDLMELLEAKRKRGDFRGQKAESIGWTIDKLRLVKRIFKSEDVDFFDTVLKLPIAINLSGLRGVDIAKNLVVHSVLQRLYERCETMDFSALRMMVVMDEAHLILKTESREKIKFTMEPLPLRLVREGRKYGFGIVLLSQLATDVREEAAANTAFVAAFAHDQPKQVRHACDWINLSQPEREIYRTLPRGGTFIKETGKPYPALARVQVCDDTELAYARSICRKIKGVERPTPKQNNNIARPITKQNSNPTPHSTSSSRRLLGFRRCSQCGGNHDTTVHNIVTWKSLKPLSSLREFYQATQEKPVEPVIAMTSHGNEPTPEIELGKDALPKPTIETKTLPEPKPTIKPEPTPTTRTAEPELEDQNLTPSERQILRQLILKPSTIHTLQAKLTDIKYEELLKTLNSLEAESLLQVVKVANLLGKGTVFYGALKASWLQSESLEHRCMLDLIVEALVSLRPVRYSPTRADYPDLGLELAIPKTAVEVETGRKKLSAIELDKWAEAARVRDTKLGYERIIVVVPNQHVLKRYAEACQRHGLEPTTMAKLLSCVHAKTGI